MDLGTCGHHHLPERSGIRSYAARHPQRCHVVADEQLPNRGVLVQAYADLSGFPRGQSNGA
ncbi:hypothetical protein ACIPRL_29875 [Streptomyces sp. NPDC090085]|uniref:hypothetical protein n=1 Tax=Streptomyces sp. NPDC090085 TaxID=3365943 RepID=UPI0037F53B8E